MNAASWVLNLIITPEHQFQLLITIITVIPATIVSAWALINQIRQTQSRLAVLTSPIQNKTIQGESILADEWPGIVVRNLVHSRFVFVTSDFALGNGFILSENRWDQVL